MATPDKNLHWRLVYEPKWPERTTFVPSEDKFGLGLGLFGQCDKPFATLATSCYKIAS